MNILPREGNTNSRNNKLKRRRTELKGPKLALSNEDTFVNTNHGEISLMGDTSDKSKSWKNVHCKVQGVLSLSKDTEKDKKKLKILMVIYIIW